MPLLAAATALVYFYGLGRAPFFGADEPRYAEVAREMYARGDLVTPTLGGHTWFEKPALGYWAQMAGFGLFGTSERAARLGVAMAGWLTVLFVGWMCGRAERHAREELGAESYEREAEDERGEGDEDESSEDNARSVVARFEARTAFARGGLRLACAGVMASSAGLIVFARAVNFDIFLTATIALSLACFFVAELERDARKARLLLAGFYAGAGCALLAKGLVGVVIPFGVVALYQILRRRLPRAPSSLWWGVPLVLLVAAAWYAPVWYANGHAFFDEFFIKHHFARFVSNKYHHPQPFYFYLLITPLVALPWTPLVFAALTDMAQAARAAAHREDGGVSEGVGAFARALLWEETDGDAIRRLRLFAFAWLLMPVVFFSASQSKLPGYVLPALPGAAVLAGCELWFYARGARHAWAVRATGCVMLCAAAGLVAYAAHAGTLTVGCALIIAAPLAAGGTWAVLGRGGRARRACVMVGAPLLATMLAADCAQEAVTRRESVRALLLLAARRGYADAPVVNLYGAERSSEYYAAGRLIYDEAGEPKSFDGVSPVAEYARGRGATVLVIVPAKHAQQLLTWSPIPAEMIGDNGANAVVALHGEAR